MLAAVSGTEYIVGALADDTVAGEAREPFEGAVGEDVAAILDVLGGDAHRNVVEHRFRNCVVEASLRDSRRWPVQSSCVAIEPPFGSAKCLTRTDLPLGNSVISPSGLVARS